MVRPPESQVGLTLLRLTFIVKDAKPLNPHHMESLKVKLTIQQVLDPIQDRHSNTNSNLLLVHQAGLCKLKVQSLVNPRVRTLNQI
jgi:hypothetical protein